MLKKLTEKETLKKIGYTGLVSFLLFFMLLIFGPAEIFFANCSEFGFVYGEFALFLALAAFACTIGVTVITMLLPGPLYRLVVSGLFGATLAGYIQIMFLNGQLDLMGENPDGYLVDPAVGIRNLLVWIVVIAAVAVLAFWKSELWKKAVGALAAFLLAIQCVAYLTVLLTAPGEAYSRVDSNWHLSGEEQYVVSANENVIVLILDRVSSRCMEEATSQYPDLLDCLHDFTFYNNMDCQYYGTFPSMPHLLTGQAVDPSIPINEWFRQIWSTQQTKSFYDMLQEKNFVCNLYTVETHHVHGTNSMEIMADSFDNVTSSDQNVDVFYKLLWKTMTKMSCYRMAPQLAKNLFYVEGTEYADVVTYSEDVAHTNWEFYEGLTTQGLTANQDADYFVVQHLQGGHEYTTSETCTYKESATREETYKGCMVLVEEYLNQLKELGVYDNATIIVTADHGEVETPHSIFFLKQKGESREKMQVTDAPVTLDELIPTVAEAVGADYQQYGQSVHDFASGESRERTFWLRGSDGDRPFVPHYAVDREAAINVYDSYTYTGDLDDLLATVSDGPDAHVDMVDSFN